MKKTLTVILLIISVSFGYSQKPDLNFEDKIKSFVSDSESNGYWKHIYKNLKKSHRNILSSQDCMLFYYSNGVKSVKLRPFPSLLFDSRRTKMITNANKGKLKKVKEIGLELIEVNPFDIGTLIYLSMAIDKLDNNTNNVYYKRIRCIIESIFSTGDGKSPETAFKISEIGDDDLIIGFTGFEGRKIGEQDINGNIYSVWENQFGEKMYFDYAFLFF